MNEVEIINRSDKKTDRVIKPPAFLFSAANWSHLGHSWPGLN